MADVSISSNNRKYSMEEYSALRNEIVSISEQSRNVWITMVTLYVALFVLAIETNTMYVLLISYIILIPFQYIINSQKWSIQKISTYLRCFFEDENVGIHWENLHLFPPYKEYRKKHGDETLGHTIISTLLGALSSLFFIGHNIYTAYQSGTNSINTINALLMILSVGFFIALLHVNLKYNTEHAQELEQIIRMYKENLDTKRIEGAEE